MKLSKFYKFIVALLVSMVLIGINETTTFAQTPVQVTSTQPANGATGITISDEIVVIFNRPIVPLTGIDDQEALPQPLTIQPPVEGKGTWLNTSVYTFQPATGFAGGTDYVVTVADLTALDGGKLEAPYTFSFSTVPPTVVAWFPYFPYDENVKPDTNVRVAFSQLMDHQSTNAAFSLISTKENTPVDGEITWDEENITLIFTPTTWLNFGETYAISVEDTARPASGQGGLHASIYAEFTVMPLPAIESITPEDGLHGVDPERSVVVQFNTDVSPTLVLENIHVTPLLTTTQVYSHYADYAKKLTVSWFMEPQTTYTLTLGAEIADNYGNTLGEDVVTTFTTGDYSSFVQTNLGEFTHFSAFTDTLISVLYRNIESLEVELFRLPERELIKLTGENAYEVWNGYQIPDRAANRVWSRSYTPSAERNITAQQIISLTTASGDRLQPGIYLLEIPQPFNPSGGSLAQGDEKPSQPLQQVIILGNRNLVLKKNLNGESLVWLTDLRTGLPIADQPVRFYHTGTLVAEATTDEDGLARADLALSQYDIWAPILVTSGDLGSPDYAVTSTEWNDGIGPWEYNIPSSYSTDQFRSYFYTDRPIYRPGQTIYWKGIIRRIVDEAYELPPTDLPISITVRDDRGNEVLAEQLSPNEHGTISGEITLSADAVTGFYYIEAIIQAGLEQISAGTGFQVAAYRKPEFEITVTTDTHEYTHGDTITVTTQANYFSGGPLADAEVDWYVLAEPYHFFWQDSPDDRYYSFATYNDENNNDPYRNNFYGGLVSEGRGRTDADGRFTLELPADLADHPQSQRWVIAVTVQSSTNQFVNGSIGVPIHKSDFYVGISPQRYLVQQEDESTVDLVTVLPTGVPQPNQELQVTVAALKWNSVYAKAADGAFRWRTSVERTPLLTKTVTTDANGLAQIRWTPTGPGQYQIVAGGEDTNGNQTASTAFVHVSGQNFVAWRRENNDRIELVADRDLYEPGDVAKVLIPSPFSGPHKALITIERDGIIDAKVIELTSNSHTLEIPITADQIPNVYVSVLLVKGIDKTNPLPAMRLGYLQLAVDPAQKELTVEIEPSATELRPGDVVSYTLQINDSSGAPAPNTEVSVALVDKAVFALAGDASDALFNSFYSERPLGVQTSALLAINKDRLSQQLTEGAKGGGGGGGPAPPEVRKDFLDIAFWRANFVTDKEGTITFDVELPDNLTTWVLVARAISDETLVGEATNEVIASKPLQIRPLLPRFFTAGDRAQIRAVVINNSDRPIDSGMLTFVIDGSTIDFETNEEAFTLAPGGQTEIDIPVHIADNATELIAHFWAADIGADDDDPSHDALSDSIRITVPIQRYESPEVVSTAGVVPIEGRREAIQLPQNATDNGELLIKLEPSLAAGMVDGLNYLKHYPYECNEQTVSRFLPNLFTQIALQKLRVGGTGIERELAAELQTGVQRLISRQNTDGGWGYWPGEESSPFVTSYVLWGLSHAQKLQQADPSTLIYRVPETKLAAAVDYLERGFVAPKDVIAPWRLNEMAFTHYVLAEMGQGDPGRMVTLFEERERLALYGQAYLALAMHASDSQENAQGESGLASHIQTLLDDIWVRAELTATGAFWHEDTVDYRTLNTDLRTTAIVLAAFTEIAPDEPLLPNVVRWLMDARKAGHWATTQENAWTIIALTNWLEATGELDAAYQWDVALNQESIGSGRATAENLAERVELRVAVANLLRDKTNDLSFGRNNATGALYYTTQLRYNLDALAVDSRDRGVVVAREFHHEGQRTNSARVGDVISVTVTIVAPTDLYHLLVEAPIPAGTEPINPRLKNESNAQSGPSSKLVAGDGDRYNWRYWNPTHVDLRDDKVAFFASYLPAGTYEYTFQVRAGVPGEYRVLPAYAEQMYFNEVWGRSAGGLFTVRE